MGFSLLFQSIPTAGYRTQTLKSLLWATQKHLKTKFGGMKSYENPWFSIGLEAQHHIQSKPKPHETKTPKPLQVPHPSPVPWTPRARLNCTLGRQSSKGRCFRYKSLKGSTAGTQNLIKNTTRGVSSKGCFLDGFFGMLDGDRSKVPLGNPWLKDLQRYKAKVWKNHLQQNLWLLPFGRGSKREQETIICGNMFPFANRILKLEVPSRFCESCLKGFFKSFSTSIHTPRKTAVKGVSDHHTTLGKSPLALETLGKAS